MNLSKRYHHIASESIGTWYEKWGCQLCDKHKHLTEYDKTEIIQVSAAFSDLAQRRGAIRHRRGSDEDVSIGPTAASKILHSIRPNGLLPWDRAIRVFKGFSDGSLLSYCNFLISERDTLIDLERQANANGHALIELPILVGRRDSTPVKLIDEYNYVTITRRFPVPSAETLSSWLAWR
jgi:hypothetical protein